MKKLLLTLTMAVASLGGLATSAQAHPGYAYHCYIAVEAPTAD